MATQLSNEELENVTGGCGGPGDCSGCKKSLTHEYYYTCKFSVNPNNHDSYVTYKFCTTCCNRSDIKDNPCYWDWESHLG